jgi:hypothetical protein
MALKTSVVVAALAMSQIYIPIWEYVKRFFKRLHSSQIPPSFAGTFRLFADLWKSCAVVAVILRSVHAKEM